MSTDFFEIIRDEAREKLSNQLAAFDAVDQKISIGLGFAGVVLTTAFGLTGVSWIKFIFCTIGKIAVAASVIIYSFGYRRVLLDTGLSIDGSFNELQKLKDQNIQERREQFYRIQIEYLNRALKKNAVLLRGKNEYNTVGLAVLIAGFIFFAIGSVG